MAARFHRNYNIIPHKLSINERLVNAIKQNCFPKVQHFLEKGADPNYYSEHEGLHILFLALKCGNQDIFDLVLDHPDLEIDVRERGGNPITKNVVMMGLEDSLAKLINKGADVNYVDNKGTSLLLLAINCQNDDIIGLLLRAGAEYDNDTIEELVGAIEDNIEGIFDLILSDRYQPPSPEDVEDWLVSSVYAENVGAVKHLLGKFPGHSEYLANYHDDYGTLIHHIDNLEIIEILLKLGTNPNVRRIKDGNTKLHMLTNHNTSVIDLVRLLLKYGADPNIKNLEGKTVFDIAKERGLSEILSILNEVEELKEPADEVEI